jgi:uncharacterized protein
MWIGGSAVILVEKLNVRGIPTLHIVNQDQGPKQLPLVIFIHGFTSAKENNLHYAYLLAEKGMRVVLPEALHHGERHSNSPLDHLSYYFWDIVISTIEEINIVKEYFEEKGLIDVKRIGLAGTSMGGIVTLGALTKYEWIHSAVSLMGLPQYVSFAQWQLRDLSKRGISIHINEEEKQLLFDKLKQYDLSLQPEKLSNRPLFFWHGKQDQVVPFQFSFAFFETIRNKGLVEYLADEKAGHQVSREGLLRTVEWFETHLMLQASVVK